MAEKGLEARVAAMEKALQRLKDIEAIRKLEHAYSFYLVMWMPDEIMDLFSDRPAKGIDYGYPSGYILPFHFKHPVTGKSTSEGERNKRIRGVKEE